MTGQPGVTASDRSRVTTLRDTFNLFFTPQVKELIIRFTNDEGKTQYGEITCSLRFDDKPSREARVATNKMAHVQELFDLWSQALRDNYLPYEFLCVDEQLFPFTERCDFKQYIPTKPRSKCGLKLLLLRCCRPSYCCNIQLYTGKAPGGVAEKNQGQRVVLDLVEYLGNKSGRNLTTDNFFTSMALGEALLKKNISLVGTMRKNREEIPSAFLPSKSRAAFSSYFGHTPDFTLVSFVPKKVKAAVLLSSMHLSQQVANEYSRHGLLHRDVDEETEEEKPEIFAHYNRKKAGVDTLDYLTGNYSVRRKTPRWPMALFYDIVDISALNSYVVWTELNPDWHATSHVRRRRFLHELSGKLMESLLRRRSGQMAPSAPAITRR
ncbi:hypothetical protein RvY_03912 [Ramazzottius varieornatus]|uniref:PiggyBac transposable element-derived protein domain-containing protein n=1 Tax=Ramazzottius varieornatus TaxID=947166 RepID=A0A1D1UPQ3_RAMVA|nr:hypothetical protein RvY_03912 [Ramazzottius varieornatus]